MALNPVRTLRQPELSLDPRSLTSGSKSLECVLANCLALSALMGNQIILVRLFRHYRSGSKMLACNAFLTVSGSTVFLAAINAPRITMFNTFVFFSFNASSLPGTL